MSHKTSCQAPIQGVFRFLFKTTNRTNVWHQVDNHFVSHNLCTGRTLSDFWAVWAARRWTVWSSLFLMSVKLLSSTQAVTKRNKNVKQNRQITPPLWVWDRASHISCQWPNRKQGTKGHQVQQTTLPSQRGPPHFAGALFTHKVYVRTVLQALSSSNIYSSIYFFILIIIIIITNVFLPFVVLLASCYFNALVLLVCSALTKLLVWSQSLQDVWPCTSTLVTQQWGWSPVNKSLARPSWKAPL